MYSKDGIGIALQQAPMMSEENANTYGSMGKRVVLDQVFGTGGLQLTAGETYTCIASDTLGNATVIMDLTFTID